MRPSSKAYNFINNHIEILDESVEDFLQLTYMEKIQNRYVQEIVAMLNDANIETNEYQWKLFIDKFNSLRNSIENEDKEKMKEIMRLSTKRRSLFDKK